MAVSTVTDRIIFVYGPCTGATHEMVMTKASGLLRAIPPGFRILADGGFCGDGAIIVPYRRQDADTADKLVHNRLLASLRWKIEAAFSRLKNFGVLKQVFRHNRPLEYHRLIFLTIVAVYNIDIVSHPLQDVLS